MVTDAIARSRVPSAAAAGGHIDVEDCVLLVVDLQEGWFSDRLTPEDRDQLFVRATWLAAVSVEVGVPAVVTEEAADSNGATVPSLMAALTPGTTAMDKPTFDVAGTPDILDAVRATGRSTVVVIGMETDVCIAQSAFGLADAGFRVVVVADVVAAPRPAHTEGLGRLAAAGIELVGAKALFYEWTRSPVRADQVLALLSGRPDGGLRL